MNQLGLNLPFRLGTSSYIIPDDILPNVRFLADRVDDIELVLFEVDDGPNNLPSPAVVHELAALANGHNLTYTVHLPLDLRLGALGQDQHVSLVKAQRVIERTAPLNPWAYVLHLEGRDVMHSQDAGQLADWQEQAVQALQITAVWAGSLPRLAVENLEGYPRLFNLPVLDRAGASVCLDIGHLWRDGHDPLPMLDLLLARTRVIHIHGIQERDHQSLAHMKPDQIDAVFRNLTAHHYSGVVTMEIFSEEDFTSSFQAIQESLARLGQAANGGSPCPMS